MILALKFFYTSIYSLAKCSPTFMGQADNQLTETRHSYEVKGCNTMTICVVDH